MNKPKVIGITGGISCGKTTITDILESRGYKVVDADVLVEESKKNKGSVYTVLHRLFGNNILDGNNNIDNKKLAKLIFENKENKKIVDHEVHPIVYDYCKKEIMYSTEKIIFLSVPLLFESEFDTLCNEIICIYVNEETQIIRLMNRNNISKEEAIKRIQSQMPLIEKCNKSNYVIDNSNNLKKSIEQLNIVLQKIESEAE